MVWDSNLEMDDRKVYVTDFLVVAQSRCFVFMKMETAFFNGMGQWFECFEV